MVSTHELLSKKKGSSKLFKKVSYKPWETTFIGEDNGFHKENKEYEKNNEANENECEKQEHTALETQSIKHDGEGLSIQANFSAPQEDSIPNYENIPIVADIKEVSNSSSTSFVRTTNDVPVKPNQNISQTLKFRVQSLMGISQMIMLNLMKLEESRDENFIYCEPIDTNELALLCNGTSYNVLSATINKLKKREILFSVSGKRGRGGYSVYSIPLRVVNEIEKWQKAKYINNI